MTIYKWIKYLIDNAFLMMLFCFTSSSLFVRFDSGEITYSINNELVQMEWSIISLTSIPLLFEDRNVSSMKIFSQIFIVKTFYQTFHISIWNCDELCDMTSNFLLYYLLYTHIIWEIQIRRSKTLKTNGNSWRRRNPIQWCECVWTRLFIIQTVVL